MPFERGRRAQCDDSHSRPSVDWNRECVEHQIDMSKRGSAIERIRSGCGHG